LSLCHISLNDFPKALELHKVARRHCEQKDMPILVAYADYNIAYLHFLRGEYGRSIQMLRDASVSAKKRTTRISWRCAILTSRKSTWS
jgi:hypothetical protein